MRELDISGECAIHIFQRSIVWIFTQEQLDMDTFLTATRPVLLWAPQGHTARPGQPKASNAIADLKHEVGALS